VLFAGTPAFARASLESLVAAGVRPVAVLTQPDRPAGRGKKLTASAVKQFALANEIPVLQPASLRDVEAVAAIEALQPDIIIVAAYGLILPQEVLDIPVRGCLNVHASLLPRWRGAAPIQAAILAGDEQTGISLMAMTAGLDCGPVYARTSLDIRDDETAGELHDRLAELGANLLVEKLSAIVDGLLEAEPQDEEQLSYASKVGPDDARIDWQRPAADLDRVVRAFNPVPGAHFMLNDERVKCWRAAVETDGGEEPGTVLRADRSGIVVACGEGALSMQSLQRPGRKPVSAAEFAGQLDLHGKRLA
jgi:methionyl-tRNA formyltransferase